MQALNMIAQLHLSIRFLLVLFRVRRHHPVTHQVIYLMTYRRLSGGVLNFDLMNLRSERNPSIRERVVGLLKASL